MHIPVLQYLNFDVHRLLGGLGGYSPISSGAAGSLVGGPDFLVKPAFGPAHAGQFEVEQGHDFFFEVSVDYGQEQSVVLRSFVSSVPLEDYAHYVRLPEW